MVLEAQKVEGSIRAAVNIRGGEDIKQMLEAAGVRVCVIPSRVEGEECPVTTYLRKSKTLYDAYLHPGDFGVEPTTTILGEKPKDLVDVLKRVLHREG